MRRDTRHWRTIRRMFVATAKTRGNESLPAMEEWPGKCREVATGDTFPSLPLGLRLMAEGH